MNFMALNVGSSSVKYKVFDNALQELAGANVKGVTDPPARKRAFLQVGEAIAKYDVEAIGHRVVHGGAQHTTPVLATPDVVSKLRSLEPLAPLHQPFNLDAIEDLRGCCDHHVACFDTAFHQKRRDPLTQLFAIPRKYAKAGVIRYGFHGLSYEYIASELQQRGEHGHFLVAHLGSGCSAANVTVTETETYTNDTSMGFSALDGLPMGTRPGRIDAGVIQHLIGHDRLSKKKLTELLYKECGLKALAGTGDMQEALELALEGDENATEAVNFFVYSTAKELAGLTVCTDGVWGIVFTGGIGENSAVLRRMIVDALGWMDIRDVYVIPTNEELMIARHTQKTVEGF